MAFYSTPVALQHQHQTSDRIAGASPQHAPSDYRARAPRPPNPQTHELHHGFGGQRVATALCDADVPDSQAVAAQVQSAFGTHAHQAEPKSRRFVELFNVVKPTDPASNANRPRNR